MMIRSLIAALLTAGLYCLGQAQVGPLPGMGPLPIALRGYSGPGDVVSGWLFWNGLRAFSLAKAGNNAADIFCVTATTTQTIKTLGSGKFDVSSLTAACPADTYHVSKLYDQTGNTNCSAAACDLTQTTDANRPVLTLNCLNTSLPCMTFSGSQWLGNSSAPTQSQPIVLYGAGERTGTFTSFNMLLGFSGTGNPNMGWQNSANTIGCYSGNQVNGTAADSTFFAFQCLLNGASGNMAVNTTNNTGNTSTNGISGSMRLGQYTDGTDSLTGKLLEAGAGPTAVSSNLATNSRNYWGF